MNYFNSTISLKSCVFVLAILFLQSCSQDEGIYVDPNSEESFYRNALINITENDLLGLWVYRNCSTLNRDVWL